MLDPMSTAPPAAAPPGATGRVPSRREYNLQYYRLATFYLCMLAKENFCYFLLRFSTTRPQPRSGFGA